MKKYPILIMLMTFLPLWSFSQDCYNTFYQKGMSQLNNDEFDSAIKSFKAAKVCADLPNTNDIDDKIVEAQNGYIDAIQKERNKVKALYLAMLARKAFDEGDPLLGFRLSEKAYELDQNTTTQELLLNFQENYDKLFRSGRTFKSLKQYTDYYLGEAEDGSVWIFDLWGNSFAALKINGEIAKVNKLAVSPDEKYIATISMQGTPILWNNKGEMLKQLEIHTDAVYDISFAPDSRNLITASKDKTAALWTVNGVLVQLFQGHNSPLIAAEFSPDGQYILTASEDAMSIVWNRNGKIVGKKEKVYNDPVIQASFAPDSKNVVAISSSDCVVIYDLKFSDQSKREIRPKESKDPETIKDIVISGDGEYVLVLLKNRQSFDEMAILYNKAGEIVSRLNQNDLLWTKVPIENNENLLVFTKQGNVFLRRLSEKSQKTSIIEDYRQYLRELTEAEKFTFGIVN